MKTIPLNEPGPGEAIAQPAPLWAMRCHCTNVVLIMWQVEAARCQCGQVWELEWGLMPGMAGAGPLCRRMGDELWT